MGQTDLAVRFLSEHCLRELVPFLLPGHRVVVHEVMRTEVKFVERKNDEVVRAEIDGVPTVLHVEFQSTVRTNTTPSLGRRRGAAAAAAPRPRCRSIW